MIEFVKELISEKMIKVRVGGSTSLNKQTDLGIPQREVLSLTVFLVANYDIQTERRMDESLFADDLAVYITTKNQRVITRTLQRVNKKLDVWAAERGLTFTTSKTVNMIFRKRNKEPMEITLRNQIIPYK